jgi:diketogulonate reductase-like aldo/keto reductase|eukprot:COSAG06_NODE_5118_length_3709_cov_134.490028_3_plen_152_part_00
MGTAELALEYIQTDLKQLGLPYVDLLLIHAPGGGTLSHPGCGGPCKTAAQRQATYKVYKRSVFAIYTLKCSFYQDRLGTNIVLGKTQKQTVFLQGLERALAMNLTRSIGVSNFRTEEIKVRKTHFFCDAIFMLKNNILPRQARRRDKLRED